MKARRRVCVLGAGRGSAELVDFLLEPTTPTASPGGEGVEVVVVDDLHPGGLSHVAGAPVVGQLVAAVAEAQGGAGVLSGIANSRTSGVRNVIVDKMRALGLRDEAWTTYVDAAARVSSRATIGRGCVVYPGACVAVDAQVHDHALIYYNAVVHHDAVVGRGAIVCAGVLLAGGVRIGDGAYLGVGAVVRDGVTIGAGALVGMGAVVTRDVRANTVVKGVPARA